MTNQELIQQLADNMGVDAVAVETMARMCADRIKQWDVEVDSDTVTAAVMYSREAHKTMCIKSLTQMHNFAPAIYNKAAH